MPIQVSNLESSGTLIDSNSQLGEPIIEYYSPATTPKSIEFIRRDKSSLVEEDPNIVYLSTYKNSELEPNNQLILSHKMSDPNGNFIYDSDPNLSLTPIIENANLSIPPHVLEDGELVPNQQNRASLSNAYNNNPQNFGGRNDTVDNMLTLTKSYKKLTNQIKKPKTSTKSKPAFVMKLWTMVNDTSNQEFINWVNDGKSFLVSNRELFIQKILPKYFKHSNFASFVRQLNMYGWHKVQDASSGSLHSDERWQFINPNFQKDRPDLLEKIVRNKPTDSENNEIPNDLGNTGLNQLDISLLINELNTLKSNQLKITKELSRVRQDNEMLWQELFQTREKNLVQNDKIEKILQFLASVYGNKVKTIEDRNINNQPTTVNPSPYTTNVGNNNNNTNGHGGNNNNVYNSDEFVGNIYQPKPRLMLKQHRHVSGSSAASGNSPYRNFNGTGGNGGITATSVNPDFNDQGINDSPVQEIIRTPSTQVPDFQPFPYNDVYQDGSTGVSHTSNFQDDLIQSPVLQNTQPTPTATTNGSARPSLNQTEFKRPSLTSNSSYHVLSKSIEQQGQDIDDLIVKLQNGNQDQHFDLGEYLDSDAIPYDDSLSQGDTSSNNTTVTTPNTRSGLVREIFDDGYNNYGNNNGNNIGSGLKRGVVTDDIDDGEEIEEIINPSKKRKSDQYRS